MAMNLLVCTHQFMCNIIFLAIIHIAEYQPRNNSSTHELYDNFSLSFSLFIFHILHRSLCAVKMFGANISKSSKLNIDTQKINSNGEEAFRYLFIVRTFYHLWVFNSKNRFPVKNIFNIYDFHKLTNVYKHIHALLSIKKRTCRDFFLFFFFSCETWSTIYHENPSHIDFNWKLRSKITGNPWEKMDSSSGKF